MKESDAHLLAVMPCRIRRAMDIPVNGVFFWQSTLYVMGDRDDEAWDSDGNSLPVRAIASGWTSNPYDRLQVSSAIDRGWERFNGDCRVAEVLFNPNVDYFGRQSNPEAYQAPRCLPKD